MIAVILPWTPRDERRAAVRRAREEKERSQVQAGHAAQLSREIEQMAAENHFASAIAAQIMQGRHRRKG